MPASRIPRLVAIGFITTVSLAGCWKKGGDAIVLEKEHIAVAEVRATPNEQEPIASPTPSPSAANEEAETTREMRPDEIAVDGYVMEKEVRGTSKDPRAIDHEQWLVRVQLTANRRRIDVHAEQAQYEKLKPGDHVHVTYRQGKYTETIWSSRID